MAANTFTATEKAKEAEREVAMRKAVYGKGGRTLSTAQERQIAIMEAIASDYRRHAEKERLL